MLNEDVFHFAGGSFVFFIVYLTRILLIISEREVISLTTDYINLNKLDIFDYFQQEEIRKGLEKNLDVSVYARPDLPYNIMRQLRKGLEKGYNLTPYISYGVGALCELRKSMESGISLIPYLEEGYDSEQLLAIRYALEKGINIRPYLNNTYHGACISEIAIGLAHNIDVTPYAKPCYTWRKMKEIRLGIEHRLDISTYANPLYSYWQMQEIRLGLKDGLDVSYYKSLMYTAKEMRKRRLQLKSQKIIPNISGHWTTLNDDDYDIRISPDGMNAFFNWHCNRPVINTEELAFLLRKNGIVYGIDYNALAAIAKEYESIKEASQKDQNTLIATGTAPAHGHNGYYEFHFETETARLPKSLDDNTMDFNSLKWFEPVIKNQILAVYHYATPAKDGKTVTGIPIRAEAGKEKPVLTGSGFELLPDQKTYIASRNGHVRFHKNELTVTDLTILDELPPFDEPMNFENDVYIKGNITGPVTINVNGDLAVDGFVEAAEISCSGNLLLKSGIHASSGTDSVTVHGYVISKFFEYVTLHADGNIYFGTSLNSNLSSYGEIIGYGKKGGIIGGSSYSEKGYCLPNLGNPAGTGTTLLLGTNENIRSQRIALENEITRIKSDITRLTKAYDTFCKTLPFMQRGTNSLFIKTKDAIYTKNRELASAYQKTEDLEKRLSRACHSRIVVEQHVYENVKVQYMDRKITAVPSTQVVFLINNDKLIMEKIS